MGSLKGRIIGTLLVIWCWLIFTILFLAFYPTGFDVWQNLAFFIVSALVVSGIVVLIWIKMIHF
jgi:hypothetical protein